MQQLINVFRWKLFQGDLVVKYTCLLTYFWRYSSVLDQLVLLPYSCRRSHSYSHRSYDISVAMSWCLYNYVTMQWQALECFAAECSLTYDQNVKSRVNWHLSSLSLLRRAFCYAFWTNWFHWIGPTISLVLVRFSICLLVFSSVSEEFFPELTY